MISQNDKIIKSDSLSSVVHAIQDGETYLENDLISQYYPFIRKATCRVCKRYVNPDTDDEFSVALIAFSEAVHKYRTDKGGTFLSFAQLVIKRRVIDFIRSEQRRKPSLSLDYKPSDQEHLENKIEAFASCCSYKEAEEKEERREEFMHFLSSLEHFDICIDDILEESPKHGDARENMLQIAKIIVKDQDLKKELFMKKRLPINKLMTYITMSRKTVERNRKYLIALVVVLQENYCYLKEYVKQTGRSAATVFYEASSSNREAYA